MTMTALDPRGFLLRFQDDPFAGKTISIPSEERAWPLPDHLLVLQGVDGEALAMWDARQADEDVADTVAYRKVGESQLPAGGEHVARGAAYEVEDPSTP
jgi:hypothetical protein